MEKIQLGDYRFAPEEILAILVNRAQISWLYKAGVVLLAVLTLVGYIFIPSGFFADTMPAGGLLEKETYVGLLSTACLFFYVLIENKYTFQTVVRFDNGHTFEFPTATERECEILKEHLEHLVAGSSIQPTWEFTPYKKYKNLPVEKKKITGVRIGKINAFSETVAGYAAYVGLGFLALYVSYNMLIKGLSFDETMAQNTNTTMVWIAAILWFVFEAAKWFANKRDSWLIYLSLDGNKLTSYCEVVKVADVQARCDETRAKIYTAR